MVCPSSARDLPLHHHPGILAQRRGDLLLGAHPKAAQHGVFRSIVHLIATISRGVAEHNDDPKLSIGPKPPTRSSPMPPAFLYLLHESVHNNRKPKFGQKREGCHWWKIASASRTTGRFNGDYCAGVLRLVEPSHCPRLRVAVPPASSNQSIAVAHRRVSEAHAIFKLDPARFQLADLFLEQI